MIFFIDLYEDKNEDIKIVYSRSYKWYTIQLFSTMHYLEYFKKWSCIEGLIRILNKQQIFCLNMQADWRTQRPITGSTREAMLSITMNIFMGFKVADELFTQKLCLFFCS